MEHAHSPIMFPSRPPHEHKGETGGALGEGERERVEGGSRVEEQKTQEGPGKNHEAHNYKEAFLSPLQTKHLVRDSHAFISCVGIRGSRTEV